MIQGEDDTLFGLDQADRVMRGLPAATPAATAWVPGGHDGDVSVDAQLDRVTAWFDRYLKRDAAATAVPTLSRDGARDRARRPGRRRRRQPAARPDLRHLPGPGERGARDPHAAARRRRADRREPGRRARPAALTNLPGSGAARSRGRRGRLPAGRAARPGRDVHQRPGHPPVRPRRQRAGARHASRSSTTEAVLFASVWDLGPDDPQTHRPTSTVLPGRAVAPVRVTGLTPGRATTVEVALPVVSHTVPVGHRLRLVLATTDSAYAGPVAPATYRVALVDPALVLPDLGGLTASGGSRLDVPLPLVVGVGVVLLAALVGLVLLRRSRRTRGRPARPRRRAAGRRGPGQDVRRRAPGGRRGVVPGRARPGRRAARARTARARRRRCGWSSG